MAIRRFESNGRFSKVVEHNGILYIAGQVCSNPAGDIKAQTAETLAKIEEILTLFAKNDASAFITLEPHLQTFSGLNALVGKGFENPYKYDTLQDAFTDAVNKIKEILERI